MNTPYKFIIVDNNLLKTWKIEGVIQFFAIQLLTQWHIIPFEKKKKCKHACSNMI